MDWPGIIKQLQDRGWTQTQLAERCGCAQSTISALARDKTEVPAYSTGRELERLVDSGAAPEQAEA